MHRTEALLDKIEELEAEVAALRAAADASSHAQRNRLSAFASAVEMVLTLAEAGRLDLSGEPAVLAHLVKCRGLVRAMSTPD